MKQTAMQEVNEMFLKLMPEEFYSWWYNEKDRLLELEKEQLNDACYDGYYQEGIYDTRSYYDNKYKQQ